MFASLAVVSISALRAFVTTAIRRSVEMAREGAPTEQLAAVRMLGRELGCEIDDERLDLVVDLVAPGVAGPALQVDVDARERLVEGKAEQWWQAIEELLRALGDERFGALAAEPLRAGRFRFQCCLGHTSSVVAIQGKQAALRDHVDERHRRYNRNERG